MLQFCFLSLVAPALPHYSHRPTTWLPLPTRITAPAHLQETTYWSSSQPCLTKSKILFHLSYISSTMQNVENFHWLWFYHNLLEKLVYLCTHWYFLHKVIFCTFYRHSSIQIVFFSRPSPGEGRVRAVDCVGQRMHFWGHSLLRNARGLPRGQRRVLSG